MRRLLWEEWHEIRWYALALIVGPWVLLSLSASADFGYRHTYLLGGWQWDVHALTLVFIIWGATRMCQEFGVNTMSARWLPTSPWCVWAARIVPGLMAALILPIWVSSTAHVRVHPFDIQGATSQTCTIMAYFVAGYTLAFAMGMLMSSAVAVVLSSLGLLVMPQVLLYRLPTLYFMFSRSGDRGYGSALAMADVAIMALIVSVVVWKRGRNSSVQVRWRQAAVLGPISLVLLFVLTPLAVLCVVDYQNSGVLLSDPSLMLKVLLGGHDSMGVQWSPYVSPSVARGAIAYTFVSSSGVDEMRVRTRHRERIAVKADFAAPLAWLPDGNLLVGAGKSGRSEKVLEWNGRTGSTTALEEFPASADMRDEPPIADTVPSADGSKIALLVYPYRGEGLDLWVVDRAARRARLIHPGLNIRYGADYQMQLRWRGSIIVFTGSDQKLWSVSSDGSRPPTVVGPTGGG